MRIAFHNQFNDFTQRPLSNAATPQDLYLGSTEHLEHSNDRSYRHDHEMPMYFVEVNYMQDDVPASASGILLEDNKHRISFVNYLGHVTVFDKIDSGIKSIKVMDIAEAPANDISDAAFDTIVRLSAQAGVATYQQDKNNEPQGPHVRTAREKRKVLQKK